MSCRSRNNRLFIQKPIHDTSINLEVRNLILKLGCLYTSLHDFPKSYLSLSAVAISKITQSSFVVLSSVALQRHLSHYKFHAYIHRYVATAFTIFTPLSPREDFSTPIALARATRSQESWYTRLFFWLLVQAFLATLKNRSAHLILLL